jgi:16S rRNA (cytosine967-C5)-methyltransferase
MIAPMRDGGRIAAAILVLTEIETRHRTAKLALKAWGDGARYAGAKDRAFVSGLVLDVLRRRRSLAWMMGEDSDRARVLGALAHVWGWTAQRIEAAAADEHGPGALSDVEQERQVAPIPLETATHAVRGDYPDWLEASMTRVFGERRAEEGAALATRAPVDVRVNTLKSDAAGVLKALAPFGPERLTETAIRIPAPASSERAAPIEVAPEFEMGWFEVQDLGSQIAAAAAGDIAGMQVLDFCAGGGGKTLALAAAMENTGQLHAYDTDARRLTDSVRRAQRAGVANLEVRSPIHADALAGLEERMDLVFVDAPCTGSGVWRRHPDAKWRLSREQLARRSVEQDKALNKASEFVKPGGRLIYVTCSVFAEENEDCVAGFLKSHPDFGLDAPFRRLTPLTDGTDGFFIASLSRSA